MGAIRVRVGVLEPGCFPMDSDVFVYPSIIVTELMLLTFIERCVSFGFGAS